MVCDGIGIHYPAHYNGSPLLWHIVEHFLSIPNVCRSEGGGGFGEWQNYSHGFEALQGIAMDVHALDIGHCPVTLFLPYHLHICI